MTRKSLMKLISIFIIFPALFTSHLVLASTEELMTPEQIKAYMQAYDGEYDKIHPEMHSQVEESLLLGRIQLDQIHFCRELEVRKKEAVSSLNREAPDYHQKLGSVDGLWDGRREGCLDAYAAMEKRHQTFEKDLKPRFNEMMDLGQMLAIVQLELFGEPLESLSRSCLNSARMEGILKTFLSDRIKPTDKLASLQAECQGQAREILALVREINERPDLGSSRGGEIRIYGAPAQRLPAGQSTDR